MKREEQNCMSGLKLKKETCRDELEPGKTGCKSGGKPRRENYKDGLKPGETGCTNGGKPGATAMVTIRLAMARVTRL